MDFADMTVRELIAALENGTINKEDVARIPGMLGQGARNLLHAQAAHLTWPDRQEFLVVLAKSLFDPGSGRPPELAKTARVAGCDPKTLIKHCDRHLGLRTWKELLSRLLVSGIAGIATDPPRATDPPPAKDEP